MTEKMYRQERKYLLTNVKAYLLEQRISPILSRDTHAGDDGAYRIRSVYFDTGNDMAYREKGMGISDREKIRLRFYNANTEVVKLERKEKKQNLVHKDVVLIRRDTAEEMIRGHFSGLLEYDSPLAREIYAKYQAEQLMPVVVVDYMRRAYVYPAADIRVTFDYEVQAEVVSGDFWEATDAYDVLGGQVIVEVKFNRYLPEHIKEMINSVQGIKMALSKYVMCRDTLREKYGYLVGGKR